MKFDWRLEKGFSQLVDGAVIEAEIAGGPARAELETRPGRLFKGEQGVEFRFRLRHPVRGSGPGAVRWTVAPEGSVNARVLLPREAYLGNFRVPEGHYAVQWAVEAKLETALGQRTGPILAEAKAGSRITFRWVVVFSSAKNPLESLFEAWARFRNPFSPQSVRGLSESQVVHFSWTGSQRLGIEAEWALSRGWVLGGEAASLEFLWRSRIRESVQLWLTLRRRGSFSIRLSRRRGFLRFSVRRESLASVEGGFEVALQLIGRPSLHLQQRLADPLVEPIEDKLQEALSRKFEISLGVESARWKRRRILWRVQWNQSQLDETLFPKQYREILSGRLRSSQNAPRISGAFEEVRGRRQSVQIHLLNWIRAGRTRTAQQSRTVELTATGDLVVEEGLTLEEVRYRWDEIQFLRLAAASTESPSPVRWSFGQEGKFSRPELIELLRTALHLGAVKSFELRPGLSDPLHGRHLIVTEFAAEGLDQVRRASPEKHWTALVRSLELAEPQHYGPGCARRDWVDHPEVRQLIERDPVAAHLKHRYPIAGRSEFQRKQTVTSYRKARSFLRRFERWSLGEIRWEDFQEALEIPVFIFFHLLCPKEHRRSAFLLVGDLELSFGDEELLQEQAVRGF